MNTSYTLNQSVGILDQKSLLIIHDRNHIGGVEKVVIEILTQARAWGFKTYLLTSRKEEWFDKIVALTDGHLHVPIPYPRKPPSWLDLPGFLLKARRWVATLPKPLTILSADFYTLWAALKLKDKNGSVYSYWQSELRQDLDTKWVQYGALQADGLIAATPVVQSISAGNPLLSLVKELNPVISSTLFDPTKYNKNEVRAQLGFQPTDKVAICTGRIGESKGQRFLAEHLLNDKRLKDWHLLIVGPINEGQAQWCALQQSPHANRLHLTGPTENIAQYLAAADLSIYAGTCRESFGLSMVEAVLMGLPIIFTDVGILKYWLPTHPGLVFAKDQPKIINLWAENPPEAFLVPEKDRENIRELTSHHYWASRLKAALGLA